MKRAYLTAFGNPADVVTIRDDPGPAEPAADELVVRVLAAPINPAELLLIQGKYASQPPLPVALGIEGVGEVVSLGKTVSGGLTVGDRVMIVPRQNWSEQLLLKNTEVIRLPRAIDVGQAAMLKVNPATALMMLRDIVALSPGDWVIQNAANSGVGRSLIQLAKARGIKTVNVVRRESLIDDLRAAGADLVVLDGPDLAQRVNAAIDGRLPLAIDAIGGEATLRLAACLAEEGIVANYGLLSGQPCQLGADQAIFRSITLRGFWLAKELSRLSMEELAKLYGELAEQVVAGKLSVPVEATYGLDDIGAALNHAMREGRSGKILLAPAGH